jgi:hypothetical protein
MAILLWLASSIAQELIKVPAAFRGLPFLIATE